MTVVVGAKVLCENNARLMSVLQISSINEKLNYAFKIYSAWTL